MNSYKIYTRKTLGMDNRVWRLMIITILLATALLSYRLADNDKCIPFSIGVKTLGIHSNDVFYTGETITFTASAAKDIAWDFGDNVSEVGPVVYHQFLKEGKFPVTASVNSLCKTTREITIKNAPVAVPLSDSAGGKIVGPGTFYTFTAQTFTYQGPAGSYEWTVLNHPIFGAKSEQTVTYTFDSPGEYIIQVELDHDRRKRYPFEVKVEEKIKQKSSSGNDDIKPLIIQNPQPRETTELAVNPVPKTAEPDSTRPHKNKFIPDPTFLNYLEQVMAGQMKIPDFEKYGIYPTTPVTANGKEHKDFTWLCAEIMKTKKVGVFPFKRTAAPKLETPVLHRNNDVVTLIEVNYKYK